MRIVRVARPDGPAFGVIRDDHVILIDGHPFGSFGLTDQIAPLDQVRLLAPVLPSKILCVGRNYLDHAVEMGNEVPPQPLIFLKPSTAVIGPGDEIRLPELSDIVHHEAELAVVIGRLTRKVSQEDALDAVLGYMCGNDVTARDLQRSDGYWARGKGFDTFCPLGPWIETDVDPTNATVRCRVNGELRQEGNTASLAFDVARIISFCAAFTTLLPGDVLLTGTPAGVGPIVSGDEVEVDVEGIGVLRNPVVRDDDPDSAEVGSAG